MSVELRRFKIIENYLNYTTISIRWNAIGVYPILIFTHELPYVIRIDNNLHCFIAWSILIYCVLT